MKKTLSIRSYLILSHSLLLAISLAAIGLLWSQNEYWLITTEIKSLMQDRASLIASVVGHELVEQGKIEPEDFTFSPDISSRGLLVVFIDSNDDITDLTSGKVNPTDASLFQKLYNAQEGQGDNYVQLVRVDSKRYAVYAGAEVYDPDKKVLGEICLLLPLTHIEEYIIRQRWMLTGSVLLIALVGIAISIFLANNFSHHFSNAQKLAGTVSEGNYYLRIPESGPRELRDLSHYLNNMAARLNEQANLRRRLLANVAHELARPLAGLQLGIESLRKGALHDLNLADDMLVSMGKSVNGLESLIDDVVLAAKPADLPIILNQTAVAVEPLLKGAAIRYWTMAETHGVHLEVKVNENLPPLWADEKRVNQIIGNLLHNAIKFTPHGKTVYLSAEMADPGFVRIIVQDSGPGITAEDADHIFEPFYQGETGQRIKQGMGLGLAISLQLAQAHNGKLVLKNHPNGGALAILTLPVASA